MLISLSKVARPVSLDFARIMVLAAYGFDDELEMTPKVVESLSKWKRNGEEFVKTFKMGVPLFSRILKQMLEGHTAYHNDSLDEDLQAFSKNLRVKIRSSLADEEAVSREELALMKDSAAVILAKNETASDNATRRIQKNVSFLNSVVLNQSLKLEVGTQDSFIEKLESLTARLGGSGIDIDAKARTKYKGTELLKKYNKLKAELNSVPRNFIVDLVRSSGKPYLPVIQVVDALKAAGIRRHSVAEEFDGHIDDRGRYYTLNGNLLHGTPAGDVRMNPEYDLEKDNTYVCEAKAPMAQKYSRIYTKNYKAKTTLKKFEAVKNFDKKAVSIRKKWLQELKTDGLSTKDSTLALVAEIIFQTSARVGSPGNKTDGEPTFGITTMSSGHYRIQGKNRLLSYPGKKSQQQKHLIVANTLNTRLVIEHLDTLNKGKKRKDRLITFNGRNITGTALNKYLKSLGMPDDVTVHKFRTLKGTQLAQKILDASPLLKRSRGVTASVVNKWVNSALLKVAKELGHYANGKLTVATAIANYIDPRILEDFYKKLGIRLPLTIANLVNLVKD